MLRILSVFICLCLIVVPAKARTLDEGIALGDRYFHTGDFENAARTFDTTATRFPTEPIPRLARGHALFAQRKYAEASRSLQKGIRLFPLWSRSGIDLPGFFRQPGLFAGNMNDLTRKLNAHPKDPELLFLRAYCLHFSQRVAEGRAVFRRLLDLVPDHEAARTFLGIGEQKPRRFWPGGRPI